jgi:hypothetical protein
MAKHDYKKIAKRQFLKEYGDIGGGMYGGGAAVSAGFVNPGMGTFSSPDARQNLSAFANNHPTMQYPVGQHKVDWFNSDKATGPSEEDVQELKNKVTPDEILLGIEYELKRQFHKNKSNAKEIVVQNLKKDPKYYSSLHMMQMSDERVNEEKKIEDMKDKANINDKGVNVDEVKKIVEEMLSKRKKTQVPIDVKIVTAYNDSIDRKTKKRWTV